MLARLGIAGRTALLLAPVAAAAVAGAGYWLAHQQAGAERKLVEVRAAALADAVERSLGEAMGEHRPESMRLILDAVGRTQGVLGVAIAGRRGVVRYGMGSVPPELGSPPDAAQVEWSDGRVSLRRPVENGASCRGCHGAETATTGTILVRFDGSAAAGHAVAAARRMALLAGLALLLVAAAVGAVLRTAVARPLAALQRFAEALGRGDLGARPPHGGGREIGGLAEALRRMADEVQRSHEVLEGRVAERTAKLAEALGAAEAAREDRTAALTRLQAIVDSMADGVIFVDGQARVALANEAAQALRNLRGGIGRPLRDCHPLASQAMLDRVMAWLERGDDAGPAHSIIKEKEGRYETTYAPVRAEGRFLGVVMVIRDIAERRNLERRLLDAERLAGLGQMSAQVAHELRSPLNAINGAAEYLRRVLPESGEVQEYAALIGEEVQRVSRFVDELLHVSRPANPVFAPTSVNRLLAEAARRVLLARGLAEGAIRLDLEKGLPPLDVDQEMILEAVVNLLDNALEAGGAGAPELCSRSEASGGEGSVSVEVADRGAGIPPELIEEVTRPFVTTKAHGTGLGLVIVGRAAEQHRAHFSLHPREGGGTLARLRFPVRTVRAGERASEEAAP